MKQAFRIIFVSLLLVVTLQNLPCNAQSTTDGAIGGSVADNQGNPVAGASLVVQSEQTGLSQSLVADGQGSFRVVQLRPGSYTVTVTANGFTSNRVEHIIVSVGVLTSVSPKLSIGAATETVTVSGEAGQINTTSPEFSSSFNQVAIDNLPINGRRWSNFALLTPAVTADPQGTGLLSFRGMSTLLNNITVDGADNNQAFFSEERGRSLRVGYSTSQAAVEEFQVNTSNYSAEYGRSAGGVVNTVTKSGSNEFHGELYFFDRDNDWGATNPFTTLTSNVNGALVTQPYKPKDWRKEWGLGVGGPLLKNRLFFFYAFDRFLRNFPGTAVAGSPAALFASPTNAQTMLLAERLGISTTQAEQDYTAGLNDLSSLLGTVPRTGSQYLNFPKLDWQITAKHHMSLQYNRMRWEGPGTVQPASSAAYGIRSFGNDFTKVDWGLMKLDSMLSARTSNELRYQYGRDFEYESLQQPTTYEQQFAGNTLGRPPQISVAGGNGFIFGTPYFLPRLALPKETRQQIADTFVIERGRHTLKFGIDYNHVIDARNNLDYRAGAYTYSNVVNYLSDYYSSKQGHGTCNAAGSGVGTLPCYSNFLQAVGPTQLSFATNDYAGFVTDEWRAIPRLTLTLGLRYEFEGLPGPQAGLQNPGLPQTAQLPSDRMNFGPRFGFAYDVFGRGKTTVRGGYGIFYGRVINSTISSVLGTTGSLAGAVRYTFASSSASAPSFPNILASNPAAGGAKPSAIYFDRNFRLPQIQQIDLSVQQDLGWNTVFSLSYLGALGRHLVEFADANIDTQNIGVLTYDIRDSSGKGPLTTGTYTSAFYSKRVNPNYSTITNVFSGVSSSYHAAVAQVSHRMKQHVQLDAFYTWSHALDNGVNGTTLFAANDLTVPGSLRGQYANSIYNVPNRAVIDAVLTSPWHTAGWKSEFIDDWSLSPVLQVQTGLPYSLQTTGSPSIQTAAGTTVAPLGPGVNGSGGAQLIETLGRNRYTLPDVETFDLRLAKSFRFADRYNLELLGEAFNLLNHQNATVVNTTGYIVSGATAPNGHGTLTYNTTAQGQPLFGTITNSNSSLIYSPRQIQLSARLHF